MEQKVAWAVLQRLVAAKEFVDFVALRPGKVSGGLDRLPDGTSNRLDFIGLR
jgi:hypothetical protein